MLRCRERPPAERSGSEAGPCSRPRRSPEGETSRREGEAGEGPEELRVHRHIWPRRKELERLFHKKCGYCELKYKAGLTGEVEHYRPKGRILTGGKQRIWPGYYWLAATWTNLVPVCSMCNKLNVVDDLTDGTERTTGKGERFPSPTSRCARRPKRIARSKDPLLLDPCVHNPDDHLTFVEREGHRALLSGQTDKGRHTVEILGLNRGDLVEGRLERLLAMEALMNDIQAAHGRLARAATELDREEAIAEIRTKRDKLVAFQKDDQEFAALARHTVPAFLAKMHEITQAAANE